jgi:dihydroorotate dehydrogenase (fumarate)
VIKGLMAGADVIQLTSFLLRQGVESFAPLQRQVAHWLEEHEVSSVSEIRGSLSLKNCPDPAAFERAQYMQVLQGWKV